MPPRKAWTPREGLNLDVFTNIVNKTALNPALTLPLLLLSYYTRKGQDLAFIHPTALRRLKYLIYIGLARWANAYLSRNVLNNWTTSKYEWDKEIAVITGGSDGIGKHLALLLAEQKTTVIVLDVQPLTFIPPPNIHHYTCDVTSPSTIASIASTIRTNHGNPTILVNNAGIGDGLTILESTDTSVHKIFAVNILSHFTLVRTFLPAMVAANHGTVVTIASIASLLTPPQIVEYCCTKAAALAFHEGLTAELTTRYNAPGVRTVCVHPFWTETAMTAGLKDVMPMLKVETVAEQVFEKIMEGGSGWVTVCPGVLGWVIWGIRTWPAWMQVGLWKWAGKPLVGRDLGAAKVEMMEKPVEEKVEA